MVFKKGHTPANKKAPEGVKAPEPTPIAKPTEIKKPVKFHDWSKSKLECMFG